MTVGISGVLVAVLALACASFDLRTPSLIRWTAASSEHFEVFSQLDEPETMRIVRDLEQFRTALAQLTGRKLQPAPVPMLIFAFDSERSYREFAPSPDSHGFLRSSMRATYLVLRSAAFGSGNETLFHEYTHGVLRSQGGLHYPLWYDEGFAEVLSTLSIRDGVVEVGRPPPARVRDLSRALPLARVLGVRSAFELSEDEAAGFAARAWQLVHYLHFGRPGKVDTAGDLTRYLRAIESGASAEEALERGFGIGIDALSAALASYRSDRGAAMSLDSASVGYEGDVRVGLAPRDVVETELALLALSGGDPSAARRYLERVLVRAPEHSRALAAMGSVEIASGNLESAEGYFQRALRSGPRDPLNHLDYAEYLHAQAERGGLGDARRAELTRTARRHLVRATKLDDRIPEVFAVYAATFMREGEAVEKAVEPFEHAHALHPTNLSIKLGLARAYAENGRPADAMRLARTVMRWAHARSTQAAAAGLIEQLERRVE